MTEATVFKSQESRDAIRARYNQILSVFPFTQAYVETTFGSTFTLQAGAPENPALVLLHGSCSNSAFWFAEMTALSARYRVVAVDIPGEAGNSVENRLDLASEDYADWLAEVLDALGIERATLMGNSLGSWMALRFAVKYPRCVSKLILIAPSGLSGANAELLEKARTASLHGEAMALGPSLTGGATLPKPVEEFINLILAGFNPIVQEPPVFSDGQLKKLAMPFLFVAGALDTMVDAPAAAQRLARLIPRARVHLIENAGHIVFNALDYILPFLEE
ncbi:MAG TPA: alpha/beta hydrolase [Clostridia bacterium]|nr:alpha/beta hydrolase [Clostridia bacterium]